MRSSTMPGCRLPRELIEDRLVREQITMTSLLTDEVFGAAPQTGECAGLV